METTEVFDGGGTEGSPAASMFSFLLWLGQRLFYQFRTDMLCAAIPGIRKIPQGCPGVFSPANPLVGGGHGIDCCRERWRFFVSVSVILRHHAQGFKFHGQPFLPKSRFKAFPILSAFFCCPAGKMYWSNTCWACSRVRIFVFGSSIAQSLRSFL